MGETLTRTEEREMQQLIRSHLIRHPELKEQILGDILTRVQRDVFEEPDESDIDDEERRLWGLGYMD